MVNFRENPDPSATWNLWQFLAAGERQQLTCLLAELPLILTDGADGRMTFLSSNGLTHLSTELPLDGSSLVFAGRLVMLAEGEGEMLVGRPGFHALGAVCDGVLRLADAPRSVRPFLAQLIQQYALIEDEAFLARLHNEFGPAASVTPWREQRRPVIVSRAEVKDIEDQPPEPGDSPFKGLQYFDENDADRFFGREWVAAKLIGRLHQARFLAVIGASGSGKSSLVRAGVIPALRRGERLADDSLPPAHSGQWAIWLMKPGVHPLAALAATLLQDSESVSAVSTLQTELAGTPQALAIAARQALARQGHHHLLLVIDQFEEVFTLCHSPEEQQAFIENLLTAVDPDNQQPLTIMMTLRADFYDRCADYPGLRQLVSQQQEYIGAMSSEELSQAIVRPAVQGNWRIQKGLVEQMLDDVGNEPGALPLLSHALLETWARRRGRTMTLSGYQESGGVREAIARTAEEVLKRLPPDQVSVVREIFLSLIQLGEGTETMRRTALREELARAGDKAIVDRVLEELVQVRLIVMDKDKMDRDEVEVAHEALIHRWPRLRLWIDESRERLLFDSRLKQTVQLWDKLGRHQDYLFRGQQLRSTLSRIQEYSDWHPTPLQEEFLDSSRQAEENAQKEAERKVENARQALRLTLILAALGGAIGLGIAGYIVLLGWLQVRFPVSILIILLVAIALVGAIIGLFYVPLFDGVMATAQKRSDDWRWPAGALLGFLIFGIALVVLNLANDPLQFDYALCFVVGGLWGTSAGLGRLWIGMRILPGRASVLMVALLCGVVLALGYAVALDLYPGALGLNNAGNPLSLANAFLVGIIVPFSILLADAAAQAAGARSST